MIGSYSVTSLATANVIGGIEKQVATINAKNGITIQVYNGDVYQIRSALKNAKWFSENSDCVAVTTKGVLTCVGNGKTKIYAKVSGKKAMTFTVKIKKDRLKHLALEKEPRLCLQFFSPGKMISCL